MPKLTSARISRQLSRSHLDFEGVTDPRAARGRSQPLAGLLRLLVCGLATCRRTLRGIEGLGEDLSPRALRRLGLGRAVSDTTLYELLSTLKPDGLQQTLFAQVRRDLDRKAVQNDVFAGGVMSYDGKGCGSALGTAPNPQCRQGVCDAEGTPYWDVYALRSCLVSSSARPCVNQAIIGSKAGEATTFPQLLRQDVAQFPKLFRYVTGDAGLTSGNNARLVGQLGKTYLFQLKANFGKLFPLAQTLLADQPLVAQTSERAYGKTVIRQLRRVIVPAEVTLPDAIQLIGVRQIRVSDDGITEAENRVFVSSIPWDELSPERLLVLVRLHWQIENGPNWTADVMLKEDSHCPCSAGFAPVVLSWLTMLAYNLVAVFRAHVPRRDNRPMPWKRVIDWFYQLLLIHDSELIHATCA
jgi:hypothetical protein